jgi:hypothetical protein
MVDRDALHSLLLGLSPVAETVPDPGSIVASTRAFGVLSTAQATIEREIGATTGVAGGLATDVAMKEPVATGTAVLAAREPVSTACSTSGLGGVAGTRSKSR